MTKRATFAALGVWALACLVSGSASAATCTRVTGWGEADSKGAAKASATVEWGSRAEAWAGRYDRDYQQRGGSQMNCRVKRGIHTCWAKGTVCLH